MVIDVQNTEANLNVKMLSVETRYGYGCLFYHSNEIHKVKTILGVRLTKFEEILASLAAFLI